MGYWIIRGLYLSVRNKLLLIPIESALMKYKFHTDDFLSKIVNGRIEELDVEHLEMFVKLLPKPQEISKLKEALLELGLSDIRDPSLKEVKFGMVETFILKVMDIDKVELKATLLLDITHNVDAVNEFLMLLENWILSINLLIHNQALRDVIRLASQMLGAF